MKHALIRNENKIHLQLHNFVLSFVKHLHLTRLSVLGSDGAAVNNIVARGNSSFGAMSLDLSDEGITALRQAIANPQDPTTWFVHSFPPADIYHHHCQSYIPASFFILQVLAQVSPNLLELMQGSTGFCYNTTLNPLNQNYSPINPVRKQPYMV
jgi:hypothetical protein